jgi:hypothetical protein
MWKVIRPVEMYNSQLLSVYNILDLISKAIADMKDYPNKEESSF